MKIYNIYPTNEAGVQIGSAVFQSLNKAEAISKFKNLDTYTEELSYILTEIEVKQSGYWRETHKAIKYKNYNP